MSTSFRIQLSLHTPVVLPAVPPRLDSLLQEASCRLYQDWSTIHPLPLAMDDVIGGYRASQVVFVTRPDYPLAVADPTLISRPDGLERELVTNPPKKGIKEDGGGFIRKMTGYAGYLCPYLAFYGHGDGEQCADLLELLDGVGRLHMQGFGSFTVQRVEDDATESWRLRSWPAEKVDIAPEAVKHPAFESLMPGGVDQSVVRPKRVLREVTQ